MIIGVGNSEENESEQSESEQSINFSESGEIEKSMSQSQHTGMYRKQKGVTNSIYTVTIQLEYSFLQFLDDPSLIEPSDVVNNLISLTSNEKFISQVVKKELKSIR